jgi:uncharacterized protein (TIGR02757 family)
MCSLPPTSAEFLQRTFERYHHARWIGKDPLAWPRAYDAAADREVAAFLASSLAYGNVVQIDRSLGNLFRRLGRSPAAFARNFVPGRDDHALEGFYHRFNTSEDLALVIHLIGQMLRKEGSLENFWQAAQLEDRAHAPLEVRAGRFMETILELDSEPYRQGLVRGSKASVLYLLPDAGGPSACKRFFLFLRWMARPDDGIDLGLWRCISPADLEIPVDTHILRLGRYLGATARNDAGARTRREITGFLRRCDPEDPVRFDFSLCRLGIEKICPTRADVERCAPCDLQPVCLRHEALTCRGRLPRRLARLGLPGIRASAKPTVKRRA